jgi:hypothetical protein
VKRTAELVVTEISSVRCTYWVRDGDCPSNEFAGLLSFVRQADLNRRSQLDYRAAQPRMFLHEP